MSFGSRAPAPWHLDENISRRASVAINLKLDKASTSDFTVNYTIGGTATPSSYSLFLSSRKVTPGSDFVIRWFTPGTVKVPAGKTGGWASLGRIWIYFVDDSVHEDSETVLLTLVEGEGYQVGSPSTFTIVIVDDDPKPTASFTSASQSAGEGSGTHDVEVRLDPAPVTDITLAYTVTGTATSGSDYTALSGTVAVSKGAATATIPVTLIDDSAQEGSETVVLKLAAGEGYEVSSSGTHTLTIVDDDTPTASFALASQSVDEGSGTHDVEVRLDPAPSTDITLAYTVTGTATSGTDYTALSGTLSVPKGATTATVPVAVIDDSVHESSETLVLTLTAGEGYAVGNPDTHTLTIVDDEPTVAFASASQRAGEGSGTHDVEVRLDKAPPSDTTFAYTVTGTATAGSDFTIANSGTLSVPAHATTATIPVTLIDDSVPESNETVVLTLVDGGAAYQVGSPGTHTLTIAANDAQPPATSSASFASGTYRVNEGNALRPELVLSHWRSEAVTVGRGGARPRRGAERCGLRGRPLAREHPGGGDAPHVQHRDVR